MFSFTGPSPSNSSNTATTAANTAAMDGDERLVDLHEQPEKEAKEKAGKTSTFGNPDASSKGATLDEAIAKLQEHIKTGEKLQALNERVIQVLESKQAEIGEGLDGVGARAGADGGGASGKGEEKESKVTVDLTDYETVDGQDGEELFAGHHTASAGQTSSHLRSEQAVEEVTTNKVPKQTSWIPAWLAGQKAPQPTSSASSIILTPAETTVSSSSTVTETVISPAAAALLQTPTASPATGSTEKSNTTNITPNLPGIPLVVPETSATQSGQLRKDAIDILRFTGTCVLVLVLGSNVFAPHGDERTGKLGAIIELLAVCTALKALIEVFRAPKLKLSELVSLCKRYWLAWVRMVVAIVVLATVMGCVLG